MTLGDLFHVPGQRYVSRWAATSFVAAGTSLVVGPINQMFSVAYLAGAATAIFTASDTPFDPQANWKPMTDLSTVNSRLSTDWAALSFPSHQLVPLLAETTMDEVGDDRIGRFGAEEAAEQAGPRSWRRTCGAGGPCTGLNDSLPARLPREDGVNGPIVQ